MMARSYVPVLAAAALSGPVHVMSLRPEVASDEGGASSMAVGKAAQTPTPEECKVAASHMIWDKFCEFKANIPNPSASLWDGAAVSSFVGVAASVERELNHFSNYCSRNPSLRPSVEDRDDMRRLMSEWFSHGNVMCKSDVQLYFGKVPCMDSHLNTEFGGLHARAMKNELDHWTCFGPDYLVALAILYDQVTRDLGRRGNGKDVPPTTNDYCEVTPNVQMYSGDAKAQAVALWSLISGKYHDMPALKKQFIHLIFTHSESPQLQLLCNRLTEDSLAAYESDANASEITRLCTDEDTGSLSGNPLKAQYVAMFNSVWRGTATKHAFVVDVFGRQPHQNSYVPGSYYESERNGNGWIQEDAVGPRSANSGKWATGNDVEPVSKGSGAPEGWSWTTPGCPDMVGEVALANALPFQFSNVGLPAPGDGDTYDGACSMKAGQGGTQALLQTQQNATELHWLD